MATDNVIRDGAKRRMAQGGFVPGHLTVWGLCLLLPVVLVCGEPAADPVTKVVLLQGGPDPLTVPHLLEEHPHQCAGNVNHCPNGFTVSFTFRPTPPRYDVTAEYLVTSGGQSMLSEGFYVRRNHGMEYEVGVAKGTKLWAVFFDLDDQMTGRDVNVLLSWIEGLDVYVDGFQAGSDATGSERTFTRPAFDPYRKCVVGGAQDELGSASPGLGDPRERVVYGLTHWDSFYRTKDIASLLPAANFKVGCVVTPPDTLQGPQDLVLNEDGTETAAEKCRFLCFGRGNDLAYISADNKCVCHTPEDIVGSLDAAESSAATAPCWSVYLVTSSVSKQYPIRLSHTEQLPTNKGYTRPNETVIFKLTTDTPTNVTFHVNFGDGISTITSDTMISHYWVYEGSYVVNITAMTRSTTETQLVTFKIENIDEGVAPNLVQVQASIGPKPREVKVEATAISPAKMSCILNLGDGRVEKFNGLTGLVHKREVTHIYEAIGLYDVSMTCTNDYGMTQDIFIAPSLNKSMDYETSVFGKNIIVPFYGADTHHTLMDVEIDHLSGVSPVLSGAEVLIPGNAFTSSGEHLLQLKSQNEVLRRRVVNLQKEIISATITTGPLHTEKDMPIQIMFKIFGGDHQHVLVEYGDGEEEWLYYPQGSINGPIMIHRNHSYTALGKFYIKLAVANDVSSARSEQMVSIERPIFAAKVSVRNVTFLGDPAEFVFEVDYGIMPAMPVRVDFDLGNGERQGGEIGDMRNDKTPASFFYTYPKYGLYDVIITVSNNLSSLVLLARLQVGENITYVDMNTKSQLVATEEEFEIVIDCPQGQPILYEVSTGDGTVIKVSVPFDYTSEHDMIADIGSITTNAAEEFETTTPYTYYTTEEMGVMVTGNGTEVKLSRKKREANPASGIVTTVIFPTENDAFEALNTFAELGNTAEESSAFTPASMKDDMTTIPFPTTTVSTTTTTTTVASTRPPNERITVKYKFHKAGQHTVKVKVSNSFSNAVTWSCPPIRVVPQMNPLECEGIKVATTTPTSEEQPLITQRSKEVKMGVSVDLSCQNLKSKAKYDYTWDSIWRTKPGGWRPELGVCHVGSKEPTLVIPPNTLWYGSYRLKVTVHLLVDPATGRVRREVPQEVEVTTIEQTVNAHEELHQSIAEAQERITQTLRQQMEAYVSGVPVPEDFNDLDLAGMELTTLSATADMFLEVQKTPLVAELKGDPKLDIPKFEVINLSAEPSYDPDVDVKLNKTGMSAHIFCYPTRLKEEWDKKSFDEKVLSSRKVANNTMDDCAIYNHECFIDYDPVWVLGWEAVFLADLLMKNDTMNFELIVNKDERTARVEKVVRVLFSNATGVDMLNNIDALLASGDTNAALMVIGLVSGMLDGPAAGVSENGTDAKKAKSAVRDKLIGALDKCSDKLENFDQVGTIVGVMGKVTSVADEVSTDSKVTAAGALGNSGDATKETAANAPVDKVTDMAGGLVGCVGNVLPFPEPEPGEEGMTTTEEPQIIVTTTSSTYVTGVGHVISSTMVVTTPTTRTVTTSSPEGVSVTTTPIPPTYTPTTTPAVLGNITVTVEGVGEVTLSEEGWSVTTPLPPTTTTTTTTAPTTTTTTRAPTTTTTTRAPTTTTTPFHPTTKRPTTTAAGGEGTPAFMTTLPPGMEPEPTEEPVIPCCFRTPESGLCEWVEPACDFLAEDDRKSTVWSNETCDEIHPDDLEVFVVRFRMFKAMLKRIMFGKRKSTTTNAMRAVDGVGDVLIKKSGEGTNISISTPKMKVELGKLDGGANGTSGGGMGFLGSAMNGSSGSVGSMSTKSPNPFTYSDTASDVKSDVKSLSFKDENGTAIVVEDSAEPIDIWIEGQPHLIPPAKLSLISSTKDSSEINFHNVGVPSNDSSMHVIIRPDNPDDEFEVYIKYTEFPNETYYDYKGNIPNPEMETWDIQDADDADDLRHTFFPDTAVTALNGSYKIGVKLIKSVISYKAKPGEKKNSTYTFRVFLSGCRFWDDENDTWSSGGCWVGNLTTIRVTQCQCNHLTSFGGDFVVPPNTIDFSTVFSLENFLEAIPVFVTVGLVLLLYVAVLIWARRQDKNDLIKWGAAPLEDNLPSDTYHYQITVNTGVKKTAGTTSRVSFILSGDTGDTGVRRLCDDKRKDFPSSSIYNFVLSVEQCLGPLTYLRIWHDNTGKGKKRSWMLGQIQINDLQTGEKFFFLCNRWLAVEEDDGMVERILPVAGLGDLTAFKHLFNSSVRKKLTNDHMWVSIMSRPTRSTFTRVQRLSCCVSLLFLTMITNCMFFKSDEKVEKVSSLKIGPLSFTLHQVFISIVTTGIVFPPSMIIVIIFRKARGKKNTVQQMNQVMSKKSKKFKWRTFNPGSSYWSVERTRTQKCKDSLKNFFTCSNNKSKYEEENADDKPLNKKKKKNMTLPHWTIYIAWFLVLGSILGSGFFTVLYSMEWGREKSLEWLSTFLLSFFQSVAVVQPFKVLLLAAFISCVLRKPDLDDEEGDFDQMNGPSTNNSALMNKSQKDLQALMMQRKMANDALKPPDTEALEASRKLRMQELQMEAVLKECIIYLFFLMVLFFLSYQARDADSFLYSENIKNTFIRNSPSLDNTYSVQTWWKFMNKAVIPNLYSGVWYNGRELDWRERLQIDDRNTMRVGVGRLRQHRIKDDTCIIRKEFQTLVHHCRDAYSWTDDDTKDYLTAWEVPSSDMIRRQGIESCYMDDLNDSNETSLHDEESPWVYRSSIELKNAPYQGTLAIYKGGGYTFTFKRTMDHTLRLMQELERYEWVDVNTRALFIEFTLYNANANLFGSVIMLVEFMSTGSAITKCEVKVFRLSSYIGGFGILVVIFEVMFLGFIIFFFVNTCKMLKKERLKFFGEFWNLLEFSMLIMAIISIAMYAMKKVFGNAAMTLLKESESADYVNFVTISIWDELFGFILAMVVFCATIKFIKMLKFNRRMGMLGSTIQLATGDLKNFSIVFFVFFFAFCMTGYVLFGRMSPNYGSFPGAVQALFSFALGDFDFDEMRSIAPILGPLFFFLFVCVIVIGMMGMFLTIIYDSFAAVKADTEHQSNDYEIVDFIMKRFKGVFGWS